MRNRTVSLLLFAAVALVALYGRRSLLRPQRAVPENAPATYRGGPDAASETADDRAETAATRHTRSRREQASPGNFDFYLLNLSWSPAFCATHPGKPECVANPRFLLHGLWPQNIDGSYPEECSAAPGPQDPGAYSDIFPDAGLLAHEWHAHGTCSGLRPDAYFSSARAALHTVVIPPSLATISTPASRPPAAILGDFARANPLFPAGSFALSCGNNELTAIEACLDKALKPVACSQVRSCRANSVRIVPPGGAD